MKSALEQILAEQRRRQDAREDASVNRMTTFYAGVIDTLDGEIRAVTAMIERARADGTDVNPDWLRRQARYQLLQGQAHELYTLHADEGDRTIRDARITEVRAGSVDAIAREGIYGPLPENADASINQQAVERMVHQLSAESPVRDSIRRWGLGDLQAIDQHLVDGVANGYGADKIVRNIRRDLTGDVPAWRVRTLVRTENMRAYNTSLIEQYAKNQDVQQVEWVAFRGKRTCLACLAMDGKRFPIDEPPDTFHVCCRCSTVAVPYDPYGDYDYLQDVDPAEDWLRQNANRAQFPSQEAYDAFMRGDLGLQDFLGYHDDPVWGRTIYQKSGRQALEGRGGGASEAARPEFMDIGDNESWGEQFGDPWLGSLSPSEQEAVGRYRANSYEPINQNLRDGNDPPPGWMGSDVQEIDKALAKSTIPDDIMIYRGVSPSVAEGLQPGSLFTDNGYVSTSVNRQFAEAFATEYAEGSQPVIMRIEAPSGTRGAYLDVVPSTTEWREMEILLPRSTQFLVRDVSEVDGFTILDLEILDD